MALLLPFRLDHLVGPLSWKAWRMMSCWNGPAPEGAPSDWASQPSGPRNRERTLLPQGAVAGALGRGEQAEARVDHQSQVLPGHFGQDEHQGARVAGDCRRIGKYSSSTVTSAVAGPKVNSEPWSV